MRSKYFISKTFHSFRKERISLKKARKSVFFSGGDGESRKRQAFFFCFANILLYVRAPPPTANRRTWTIEFDSPINFNIQKNRSLSKITGFRGGDGESRKRQAFFFCFANILLYVRAPPPTANRRTWTIEFDSPINFNIQKNRSLSKITGFRGGDGESRTLDLSDANRTLYQLSYAPKQGIF